MGTYWTVLQTRAGWEAGLKRRLDREGFTHFHPFIQTERVSYGHRSTRLEPMFPGYLFLQLRDGSEELAAQRWSPAEELEGAIRLLRVAGLPVRLPRAFVSDIDLGCLSVQRGSDHAGAPRYVRALPLPPRALRFLPRQMVKFVSGPYIGFGVEFLRMSGTDRCKVLFSMFGRPTEMDCSVDQLVAA